MKPLSMRRLPVRPATSWVWAWPPKRLSPSKSVTSCVRLSTCAAVRPETPAPMTAAVGRLVLGFAFGRVTEGLLADVVPWDSGPGPWRIGDRWCADGHVAHSLALTVECVSKVCQRFGERMEIERTVTVDQ